jgi:perosamine synthetase
VKIPQFSPWLTDEEYKEIYSCFERNWITEGPKSDEFAAALLELTGARFGVFTPNGTLGLYLALRALGIGPGDEIIVPDFTFVGSATAVQMTGATPVFVDVNRENFQIDVSACELKVTPHTRAVMPVHIYGTCANMEEVTRFTKKHRLSVIEDAAQAIGVYFNGKHAGTIGNVGVFSFFADKTITTGEGGFIVTNDEAIFKKLCFLRNQGRINRGTFIHEEIGYNFRITDIQAAIGLAQLRKLKHITEKKLNVARQYTEQLKDIPEITFFKPQKQANWIPFRVGILHPDAHALMDFMAKKEIQSRTFFYPLHKQPCFSYLKETYQLYDQFFPNAIYGYDHGVCLPSFPTISDEQIDYICHVIREFATHE